jgi:ferric-chelate reductase
VGNELLALIDGPYGGSHSDFAAFDTVLLISASTGVTFALPILLDIAHRSKTTRLPVRKLVFLWIMKAGSCMDWVSEELKGAVETLQQSGIAVEIMIFVTCDEALTEGSNGGCKCNSKPCCCQQSVDPTSLKKPAEEDKIEEITIPKSGESYATIASGRPDLRPLMWTLSDQAHGEMGVGVCGPLELSSCIRRMVAGISDERGVSKGTGAHGIYLHVECFEF